MNSTVRAALTADVGRNINALIVRAQEALKNLAERERHGVGPNHVKGLQAAIAELDKGLLVTEKLLVAKESGELSDFEEMYEALSNAKGTE